MLRVKIYTVKRKTEDPEGVNIVEEVRGNYRTVREANEGVRTEFEDDRYSDFNDKRKETDYGKDTITAVGPEGEKITIFIQGNWWYDSKEVDPERPPPQFQVQPPRTVAQAPPAQSHSQSVYIIMLRTGPRKCSIIHSVHASVASANLAVPNITSELIKTGRIPPKARVIVYQPWNGLHCSTVGIRSPVKYSWEFVFVQERRVMNHVAADGGDHDQKSQKVRIISSKAINTHALCLKVAQNRSLPLQREAAVDIAVVDTWSCRRRKLRAAIYAQNLLCFFPVVAYLWDGNVTSDELKGVKNQSIGKRNSNMTHHYTTLKAHTSYRFPSRNHDRRTWKRLEQ
jgi:hypothetical protein